ncbi:DUF4041 domain-containing protein [Clostridium fallax]|uniref:T5orf172 domain-containing protein n=1 Tax=Clostridium fallax TaxID=1533 RepID=A0A1M4ZLJ4_9CLOT|nr:DUF4041 domain-containing protein [Clostridium fallax]SHF18825.1 T5orf172 domain-containing protein [Clostridium fallax]SQB07512.1 phage protein [Clostridium fallax]
MKVKRTKKWLVILTIIFAFASVVNPLLGIVAGILLIIRMINDKRNSKIITNEIKLFEELGDNIKQKENALNNLIKKIENKKKDNKQIIFEYNQKISSLENEISKSNDKLENIIETCKNYEEGLQGIKSYRDLEKILTTLQVGLYEKVYDFEISEEYKLELKDKQREQSECIKDDKAIKIDEDNNILSKYCLKKSDYNKVLNAIVKLALRAFNNECDSTVAKVNAKNIINSRKRVESSFDNINKIINSFGISLSSDYLKLKINEVQLAYEYEVKKAEEKEEQKQLKEQMREEAKVRAEIEKMEREAKKETELYEKALEKATMELKNASDEEKNKLDLQIKELRNQLKEAEEKMQRAKSMAEQTKAGYVYVISNIGSFGDDIYKIGMTRRLDPTERVNELSSASVPFPFDIHATIQTNDAPTLEHELHKRFEKNKVNKVNSRKEFFKVSLDEWSYVNILDTKSQTFSCCTSS